MSSEKQSTPPTSLCIKCGAALSDGTSDGLCTGCLLSAALSTFAEEQTEQSAGASLLERRQFAGYELLEEIARGGMGIVFRARQRRPDRQVALKVIAAGELATPRMVQRFQAETEASARLDHPNIASIYEVGQADGWHFFSMRLIEGPTLATELKTRPLAPDAAARLMVKIARAVHHAHQRGVLHRDLKPSNILLDAAGEPHLTDFGLAKILESDSSLTLSEAVLGTPAYMAPEQASGQTRDVTVAADVYGLGAVFYEMLAGQPPFAAPSMPALLRKIVEQEPASPSAALAQRKSTSLRQGLKPSRKLGNRSSAFGLFSGFASRVSDLDTICLKCLEKEPARRYATAAELAEDLERWLRGEPIQARTVGTMGRLSRWGRRHPGTAALLTTSVLAVAALLVVQTVSRVRLARANRAVQASNLRLSSSIYELRWREADRAAQAEESAEGIAWFAYFLRQNPQDSAAAARLLSMLSARCFPVLRLPPLLHGAAVIDIDFSRAADRLATVAAEKIARVWNLQSGELEMELPHPAPLMQCVLAGKGDRRLLTISSEPGAALWDLSSRQMIQELKLAPVDERLVGRQLVLTGDRQWIGINVRSNAVAVLDAQSGQWILPPQTFAEEIRRIALSDDGRLLAVGSRLDVRLFDTRSARLLRAPVQLAAPPADLRFSQDGHWLACAFEDKACVMDTGTGVVEPYFSVKKDPEIAWVSNTDRLLVGWQRTGLTTVFNFRTGQNCGAPFGQPESAWFSNPSVASFLLASKTSDRWTLIDPITGAPHLEPFFHEGRISHVKLNPTGRTVVSGSQDRTVRIWSVGMQPVKPVSIPVGDAAWEAQWSPSGQTILSTSTRGNAAEIELWHASTGLPIVAPRTVGDVIYWAHWAPDGTRFATASQDFTARLWDGKTGEPISPPLRHESVLTHCAFSPDGEVLATAANDRTVRLWNGRTGAAIGAPLPHSSFPLKINFSHNGRRLASACEDGTIRVWSVPDGALVFEPMRHEGVCWMAAFSPDDRLLLSASSDGTVRLWNAQTGKPALPPMNHEGPVFWASFSPDGRSIATSTESGIARVWETATEQLISEPMRHPGAIWFVKWSPDGRFLATICTDGAARIWEPFTGHLVAEPFAHQKGKEVRRAEFSPDGSQLLTASFDGTIKIWDLTLLRPPMPVPSWLPELAESLVGKRIGPKDAPAPVPAESVQRIQKQIAQTNGANDYYARWAKWMFQDRFGPSVKPFHP